MSNNNCDNPNITPPSNTAKSIGGNKSASKVLPSETKTTTSKVKSKVVPATPGTNQQNAQPQKPSTGGGGGGGSGSSAKNQWTQPQTEHGRVKGQKIPEKDPCKGQTKKSDQFKPRTIYPFNKVTQSESGHVIETDDTPGSERISLFHRSGSNYEYHPNGDVINQHVRDSYFHVFRDNYVHLGGYSTVTIDKGLKVLVNNDEDENSDSKNVNFDIHVAGNANVNIYIHKGNMNVSLVEGDANIHVSKGDINVLQDKGNYNHTVGGDYNLEVAGHMHVVVGGNVINEIGGNRDERIDGEFDQKYLTNSEGYCGEYLEGNKRTYVGGNQVTQVTGNQYETANKKSQKLAQQETYVSGLFAIQSDENVQISSRNAMSIQALDHIVIRSSGDFDIFAAEEPKKNGKFRLYSGNTTEIVTANYGTFRSRNSTIEIKAPNDIKTITRILYTPTLGEVSPRFATEPNPENATNPTDYVLATPQETQNYMKSNKKQWIPTNSKK